MKLCGIDSSTSATGVSFFIDGEYFDHVLFDHHKNKNVDERIDSMIRDITKQLQKWSPDIVWIEQPKGSGRNVEMIRKLAEILGAVRCWCVVKQREYHEIMPSQWRKWLPGYEQGKKERSELKNESIKYVKEHLNIEATDDEADSICIGIAVVNYCNKISE